MKKVLITQADQVREFQAEDPTDHIAMCVSQNIWGLPERPELDADDNPTGNIIPAEYTIQIIDISAEAALQKCFDARKSEYPTAEEFLNAFFDGGEQALAELQAKRLAVKAKYPKP